MKPNPRWHCMGAVVTSFKLVSSFKFQTQRLSLAMQNRLKSNVFWSTFYLRTSNNRLSLVRKQVLLIPRQSYKYQLLKGYIFKQLTKNTTISLKQSSQLRSVLAFFKADCTLRPWKWTSFSTPRFSQMLIHMTQKFHQTMTPRLVLLIQRYIAASLPAQHNKPAHPNLRKTTGFFFNLVHILVFKPSKDIF